MFYCCGADWNQRCGKEPMHMVVGSRETGTVRATTLIPNLATSCIGFFASGVWGWPRKTSARITTRWGKGRGMNNPGDRFAACRHSLHNSPARAATGIEIPYITLLVSQFGLT